MPTGPLTNIALLLRAHPEVAAGIERIVFMGGSASVGNVTAVAEFNVFHDPEAAAIMLAAARDLDIPVTMTASTCSSRYGSTEDDAAMLRSRLDPAAQLAGALILARAGRGDRRASATPGRCAPSSTPTGSAPKDAGYRWNWVRVSPALRPSSTAGAGRAVITRRTAECQRRWTWR